MPSADAPGGPDGDAGAFELLRVLRRHWMVLVLVPMACAALAGAYRYTRPRTYASGASFLPQAGGGSRSAISGLAAQFGVSVGGGEPGQSPQFFAELARSRAVLERVAGASYRAAPGAPERPLADHLEIPPGSPAARLDRTIDRVGQMSSVASDPQTGLVRLRVSASTPELARGVADRMLREINAVNLERRQARATADREFSEARLTELRAELGVAEARLSSFQRANRSVFGSPELQAQQDRLERDVGFRQQVYTSLAQAYEQARLDEARATPVITIIDVPATPTRPESRGTVAFAMVVGICVLAFVAFWVFAREYLGPRGRSAARAA
ncbi:Wzz/FepE/Etk N-terminal domain-containing protein [Roseisolibacter agri]|uniref:Chain length determinant protein n=1 Tax=Roseisolibacter agri TaxID=2014610 RepID=A0AA37V860_9BACT|nr:Wzz/FepE/Etk N-terminal domain-containing protein [Roseisolibacter agri]GLC27476.1 hypothetical protein rosag_39890 [Roseisolibacter agri]